MIDATDNHISFYCFGMGEPKIVKAIKLKSKAWNETFLYVLRRRPFVSHIDWILSSESHEVYEPLQCVGAGQWQVENIKIIKKAIKWSEMVYYVSFGFNIKK